MTKREEKLIKLLREYRCNQVYQMAEEILALDEPQPVCSCYYRNPLYGLNKDCPIHGEKKEKPRKIRKLSSHVSQCNFDLVNKINEIIERINGGI